LRNNRLDALPVGLAGLPALEKLDLRWNLIDPWPDWLQGLEQRGCAVLT